MFIRFLTVLVLVLGAFIAPWFVVCVGMLICIAFYRRFFEALLPAIIIDVLYGAQPWLGIPAPVTVLTALALVFSFISEKYLRDHVHA